MIHREAECLLQATRIALGEENRRFCLRELDAISTHESKLCFILLRKKSYQMGVSHSDKLPHKHGTRGMVTEAHTVYGSICRETLFAQNKRTCYFWICGKQTEKRFATVTSKSGDIFYLSEERLL